MKSYTLVFICILILNSVTSMSETPFVFGKLSNEEIDLDYYREKYPGEPAVIIADVANSKFTFNNTTRRFQYIFYREIRYIILNESGLGYGDFPIYYYQGPYGDEEINKLRGHVYNKEGNRIRRTRIRKRAGYTNDAGNNFKRFIIPFPEVRPGSVIELSYQITSDFLFNMRSWRFQWEIPVEHSEYSVNLPSFFKYRARFKGFFELYLNEQEQSVENFRYSRNTLYPGQRSVGGMYNIFVHSTRFRWVAKDLKGLKKEPFTDNIHNYLGRIFFELVSEEFSEVPHVHYTSTWEDVSRYILERGAYSRYLQDALSIIENFAPPANFDNDDEAIRWALQEISNKITWDHDASMNVNKAPAVIKSNGLGNSAEINLMLVALLRYLNIPAYPVVTSTVNNGELFSESPTITQWNYVVVQVRLPDRAPILLDATVQHPFPGYLPHRAINGRGRLIDADLNEWVNLEGNIDQKTTKIYQLKLDDMGNLTGKLNYKYEGFSAYNLMQDLAISNIEDILKTFANKTGATISNFNIEMSDSYPETTISASISISGYAQTLGSEMIIPTLLFETQEANPFNAIERVYPIIFPNTGTSRIYFEIELPENMKVSYLPQNKELTWGGFSYNYDFETDKNKLVIRSREQNNTRFVNANRYDVFREYIERMINDNIDNILLHIQE